MSFCSKIPCLLCSLFPELEFSSRVKQLTTWYRQYVLILDFNAKNKKIKKIRRVRRGRGGKITKMQTDEKRVDENEWWVSFEISYGFRGSKNSPIPKCKQDLRTFLWVRTPKAPLIPVAEAQYRQRRGLWAPHPPVPFPQKPLMLRACRRPNRLPCERDHLKAGMWDSCPQPRFSNSSQCKHILHAEMSHLSGVQLLAM